MKRHTRLSVERLEDRWTPASASLRQGILTVSGVATGTIKIMEVADARFSVRDDRGVIGARYFSGVRTIHLSLTNASDSVVINLGGRTLSGNIGVNFRGGANNFTLINGTLAGSLALYANSGDDRVTLGDGSRPLSVRDAMLNVNGGTDAVTVRNGVASTRLLTTMFANKVTLESGSTANAVSLLGGVGSNVINVGGAVTGSLVIGTVTWNQLNGGTAANISGQVHRLSFSGSNQADSLTITGAIATSATVATFGGADSVTVAGTDAVGGTLAINTGAGNDTILVSGTVGGMTGIEAGDGHDTLTMTSGAKFHDSAAVGMGPGDDDVTLDSEAAITTMRIDGGEGNDRFFGPTSRSGLTLISITPS